MGGDGEKREAIREQFHPDRVTDRADKNMGAEYGIQTNTKDKYKNSHRHTHTNTDKENKTDPHTDEYRSQKE